MIQRYKLYSLLLAAPLFIAGCSDDITTLADDDNGNKEAINICAGINSSNPGVVTRAWELESKGYYAFKQNTQISLRTEGDWTGKNPSTVVKVSTATTSAEKTNDTGNNIQKYNELSIASTATPLYWDDFGTADPNNTANRTAGLTMYAAAVDGVTTGGPTITPSAYTISWALDQNQNITDGWSKKDLLISNNIKNVTDGTDGRYKFAKKANPANLIFTHAMSQITVNLIKGDGFSDAEVTTNLSASVEIHNLATSGTVDVTNGATTVTTPTFTSPATAYVITPKTVSAGASIDDNKKYATYTALVFPGNATGDAVNAFKNGTNVLKIIVNNNTYFVTGDKMVAAAEPKASEGSTAPTSHTLKAGTNYIFNITISKTGLNITAQIADWKTYEAADAPVLEMSADRVDTYTGTTAMPANFQLYYSASAITAYTTSTMFGNTTAPVEVKCTPKTEGSATTYSYSFIEGSNAINLYWPNHTTPYNFRGVVALKEDNTNYQEPKGNEGKVNSYGYAGSSITRAETEMVNYYPQVKADNSGDYVALTSGKDDKNNVLIGTHANTVTGNNASGALATTGKVRLTFYHKMSHVTVKLATTTGADKVTLGTAAVEADATKGIEAKNATWADVKVLSYKKDGKVLLGRGAVSATTNPEDYTMPTITETYSAEATNNFYSRASYMVPQDLTNNMKFQVTVKNEDGTTDTYTSAAINTIKVTKSGAESTTAAAPSKWEPGCKYIYTLTLKKTGLEVSAVLVPWTVYEGSTVVPFM